jgi:hypothetical protein
MESMQEKINRRTLRGVSRVNGGGVRFVLTKGEGDCSSINRDLLSPWLQDTIRGEAVRVGSDAGKKKKEGRYVVKPCMWGFARFVVI